MKKNVGKADMIIRIIIAIIIGALGYYYKSWWGLVGIIPLLTAFTNLCLLYSIFGISTCRKKT